MLVKVQTHIHPITKHMHHQQTNRCFMHINQHKSTSKAHAYTKSKIIFKNPTNGIHKTQTQVLSTTPNTLNHLSCYSRLFYAPNR